MHLREPAALLRRLATYLRPGGLLAFQEYDPATFANGSYPHSPLWEQAASWIIQTFGQAGIELQMGMKFSSTFLEAGLPAPQLRYEAPIGSRPEWVGYEVIAETVRAILPIMVKFGVATEEGIGIATLADRIRVEVVSQRGVARFPALVSAWVRTN